MMMATRAGAHIGEFDAPHLGLISQPGSGSKSHKRGSRSHFLGTSQLAAGCAFGSGAPGLGFSLKENVILTGLMLAICLRTRHIPPAPASPSSSLRAASNVSTIPGGVVVVKRAWSKLSFFFSWVFGTRLPAPGTPKQQWPKPALKKKGSQGRAARPARREALTAHAWVIASHNCKRAGPLVCHWVGTAVTSPCSRTERAGRGPAAGHSSVPLVGAW